MLARIQTRALSLQKKAVLRMNYYLGRYRDVVWLLGDGRSGTTWVSDLLMAHNPERRPMFEPFHARFVPQVAGFELLQYVRPGNQDPHFLKAAQEIFTGKLIHSRVDVESQRLSYSGLLIKDIFANLLIGWGHSMYPNVKKILLFRHPFAVALSKLALKDWTWLADPLELLNQPDLRGDYLAPFENLIRSAREPFEQQIVVWAVSYLIPLRQLSSQDVHLAFYEEFCVHPREELNRLLIFVEGEGLSGDLPPAVLARISAPSRVSREESPIKTGAELLGGWKKRLESDQMRRGIEILDAFGLSQIYSAEPMPNREAAIHLLRTP